MRAGILILTLSIAPLLGAQQPRPPAAYIDDAGIVSVAFDESLLRDAEIRKQVMSGLTTNFIVRIERQKQHGRIDIRYEPWDEVFHVRMIGHAGAIERRTFRSQKELESWWGTPRLSVARVDPGGRTFRITLEIIPFSATEEADAKDWLARSVGPDVANAASEEIGLPSLFAAVVSSSIRRKPIIRYSWNVRPERKPG